MTPQAPRRTPTTLHTGSAAAAATILRSGGRVAVVDARCPALHALERVAAALVRPDPERVAAHTVLVYDSGSVSLSHAFSVAAAEVRRLAKGCGGGTRLCLVAGGLPALRAAGVRVVGGGVGGLEVCRRKLERLRAPVWMGGVLEAVCHVGESARHILDWLAVGDVRDARDAAALDAAGFTHILVLGKELECAFPGRYEYCHIKALDSAAYDLRAHFPEVVRFLDAVKRAFDSGHPVRCLVHCFAGMSRSVAAVVAYLVWTGMTPHAALEFVRDRRKAACPNDGFLVQLDEWEQDVLAGRTGSPAEHHHDPDDPDDPDDPEDPEHPARVVCNYPESAAGRYTEFASTTPLNIPGAAHSPAIALKGACARHSSFDIMSPATPLPFDSDQGARLGERRREPHSTATPSPTAQLATTSTFHRFRDLPDNVATSPTTPSGAGDWARGAGGSAQ